MIKINLLPHREAKRKELKTQFYSLMALAAILGAGVVILVGLVFSTQLSAQTERNAFITQENLELDKKIKEVATLRQEIDALKARQQAVEDLQADRNQPVFMMNELVRLAPEGLYLTSIKQEGQRVLMKGYAQSHAVVGIFVNELNSSQWMNRPEIIQNKAVGLGQGRDAKRVIEFDLNVGIRRPRELEAAAASAAAEGSTKKAVAPKAGAK
ncbi:PilN domain-containing protein [Undibacterium sp. LX40W]|uniref:PilN domain-containing protein n=1 Tax=Undibacterium nitidum TaxID=2762298 RepID=A0A923HQI1_9BURK|nr:MULTISPECIES: PilN domain-containing protein [Undibacterium]MBC3882718.1 PilN domain-containing protein [Undibacterium nitidum]MBC3893099.1 PilN domain-containing protein [Undibacterium sp. LX40W]